MRRLGDENYRGTLTDSYRAFLDGLYHLEYPPFYRQVLATRFGDEVIDATIDRRRRDAALAYHPPNEGLPVLDGRTLLNAAVCPRLPD